MRLLNIIMNRFNNKQTKQKTMETAHVFLITKGQETKEFVQKLYTGVGVCKVLAINPDNATLKKYHQYVNEDEEPNYLGKTTIQVNGADKEVNQMRVTFLIATVPEKNNGIELTTQLSFFLNEQYRVGSQSGKLQVIDKYGRTAWVTKEDFDKKAIPMYKNGPANIDKDYRPCYIGEAELTAFIKTYLGIPNVEKWENHKVVGLIDNPETAECRLDNIANYFKGDISEIKEVPTYQPNNTVRVLFGVKTTDNGLRQVTYSNMVLSINNKNYDRLKAEIDNRKSNGGLSTTEFEYTDLHEYVQATDFSKTNSSTTVPDNNQGSESDLPW